MSERWTGGRTQVAAGSHVRLGDRVIKDDHTVEVLRIQRARGRKPADGENLYLIGADETIKVNSLDGIRIVPRTG